MITGIILGFLICMVLIVLVLIFYNNPKTEEAQKFRQELDNLFLQNQTRIIANQKELDAKLCEILGRLTK